MSLLEQILDLLKKILAAIGKPDDEPQPQPEPEPEPEPEPQPQKPITRTTPFRNAGTLTPARVCEILQGYPLANACRAIGELQANALPLAQSFKESQYGKTATGNNPLGLMVPGSSPSRLMTFSSWDAAFVEWQRRMADPTYSGGVYMPRDMLLEQFIYTYAGGPGCWSSQGARCANGETKESVELYLAQTIARLNRYFEIEQPEPQPEPPPPADYRDVMVAGSSKPLRLPKGLAFRQQLTPMGQNRSGRRLNWTGTTQHTTNNDRVGMGAGAHANWQASGTPGNPGIGVHFYVDDREVVQTIPVNEQGVHSGDWRNQEHTAVELCTNSDRNVVRAEANSVALQAGLLRILGRTGTQAMHPHTNGGHCPRLSVPWNEWERRVDRQIQAMQEKE